MKKEKKRGRPALGDRKKVTVAFSVSRAAYNRLMKMMPGDRSARVSKFLERIDPDLVIEDHGNRTE